MYLAPLAAHQNRDTAFAPVLLVLLAILLRQFLRLLSQSTTLALGLDVRLLPIRL
jgi:hypothetical protein